MKDPEAFESEQAHEHGYGWYLVVTKNNRSAFAHGKNTQTNKPSSMQL